MEQGHLGLDPELFWSDPFATSDDLVHKLLDAEFEGLLLDAPRQVDIDARDGMPVVLHRMATFAEVDQTPLRRNAIVVGFDLDARTVKVSPAFRPSRPRAPSGEPPAEGYSSDRDRIDVRKVLNLDWKPSRWVVRVLLRDRATNAVRVDLGRGPSAFKDEAVEAFIEAQRAGQPAPQVVPPPGTPTPRYRRGDASPELAAGQAGLALSVDRVGVIGDGKPKPLHGSVRVPVRSAWRVPDELGNELAAQFEGAVPTAIVPVALVITDSESGGNTTVQLRVPSFEPLGDGDDALVEAFFTLDVEASLPGFTPRARTFFFYALSGEQFAGPVPLGLVSEDMLPR